MDTIAWIGFSQSLFAAILMLAKKENSLSDKILSGWLVLLSIEFLTCALDYEIFNQPLLSSSFLLFNPALFLYINSLTRPSFRLKWVYLLHLLPFVVFELYAYYVKEPFSMEAYFVKDTNFLFRMCFAVANIISWSVYNPFSLMLVHKYRMHLRDEQSNIERNVSLGWVLTIAVVYVVYCVIAFLIAIFVYFQGVQPVLPHIYNYSVLLFIVYILSFYGLRQQVLPVQLLVEKSKVPYKDSNLSDDLKSRIEKKLLEHFKNPIVYLNPDLNMDMLSLSLKTPKYQLTEVLNTKIGKNFFQFVNTYRVEAVKEMLLDPNNNFSIEAIGYECGFSSKSSFYTVFKSMTGLTPAEFKNQHSV